MKVLIVSKRNDEGIKKAEELKDTLSKRGVEAIFGEMCDGAECSFIRKFSGDYVVTLGGDGTFLLTAQNLSKEIPILPVRIEGVGFLCNLDWNEFLGNIDRFVNEKFSFDYFPRIEIYNKIKARAVNEIVIARARLSKILRIEFKVGETKFNVKGDGLIFSTALGSSAYSLSSGGSLIDQSLDVIHIVPISPFNTKIKPFVVSADKEIKIKLKNKGGSVVVDGQKEESLEAGEEVTIKKSKPLKVITFKDNNIFRKYKEKFLEGR